jgi:hypothetical protein
MSATISPQSSSAASNTSFGAVRQIEACLLNVDYVDGGPVDGPPSSSTRLAVRHSQLRRRRPVVGSGGLSGDDCVPPWIRDDALPVDETFPQRRASGARARCDRPHGRPRDQQRDRRRIRPGSANHRHRRGALARNAATGSCR